MHAFIFLWDFSSFFSVFSIKWYRVVSVRFVFSSLVNSGTSWVKWVNDLCFWSELFIYDLAFSCSFSSVVSSIPEYLNTQIFSPVSSIALAFRFRSLALFRDANLRLDYIQSVATNVQTGKHLTKNYDWWHMHNTQTNCACINAAWEECQYHQFVPCTFVNFAHSTLEMECVECLMPNNFKINGLVQAENNKTKQMHRMLAFQTRTQLITVYILFVHWCLYSFTIYHSTVLTT